MQQSLFDIQLMPHGLQFRYPQAPGYKVEGPSQEAAQKMTPRAKTLRDAALNELIKGPMSADQVAAALNESLLTIRPRIAELLKLGLIEDTGRRTINASGHSATVWRVKR